MLLCFLQKVREVLKCLAKGEKGDIFLFKVARYRVINLCCCETDYRQYWVPCGKVCSFSNFLLSGVHGRVARRTLAVGKWDSPSRRSIKCSPLPEIESFISIDPSCTYLFLLFRKGEVSFRLLVKTNWKPCHMLGVNTVRGLFQN